MLTLTCGPIQLREIDAVDVERLVAILPDDFDHDPTFPRSQGPTMAEHRANWLRHWLTTLHALADQEICEDRSLAFGVWVDGDLVGLQVLKAPNFATTSTIDSASFLIPSARGKGYGVAMRQAMLSFAFEYLQAEHAVTSSRPDNVASIKVSERVGYRRVRDTNNQDGLVHFQMGHAQWPSHAPADYAMSGRCPWPHRYWDIDHGRTQGLTPMSVLLAEAEAEASTCQARQSFCIDSTLTTSHAFPQGSPGASFEGLTSKELHRGLASHRDALLTSFSRIRWLEPRQLLEHRMKAKWASPNELFVGYDVERYNPAANSYSINSTYPLPLPDAVMLPPFTSDVTVADYEAGLALLFPDRDRLEVVLWSDDWCHEYFSHGQEWWGTCCWSTYDPATGRYVLIKASETDE